MPLCPCLSAERTSFFEEANRLYEQGKYAEAVSHYESMVKARQNSPALFFNLGNAYFKQGALGRALLNYRRAETLAPRDPDIQANLRFTRERVSGSVSVHPPVWKRVFTFFTLNELAVAGAVLLWLLAALFSAAKIRPSLKSALRTPQWIAVISLAAVLSMLAGAFLSQRERTAIITVKQATAHLGPLPESQSAFVAKDGAELRILEQRKDWMQVADRAGRTGWIPAHDAAIF